MREFDVKNTIKRIVVCDQFPSKNAFETI